MAKRFTDTEIWKKLWFRKLTPAQKCFVRYIWDDCNNAGIWEADVAKAEFFIGESVGNPKDFLPEDFGIIEIDGGSKWYFPKFLEFQYPNGIYGEKRLFVSIRALLLKYNLIDPGSINDQSSIDQRSMQDMDMDKDKDIDQKKDKKEQESKEEKERYGEFKNVLLYAKEFEKLVVKEGRERTEAAIEILSAYMESKGKKYKSHYAALLSWGFKSLDEQIAKAKPKFKSDRETMAATLEETIRRYGSKE